MGECHRGKWPRKWRVASSGELPLRSQFCQRPLFVKPCSTQSKHMCLLFSTYLALFSFSSLAGNTHSYREGETLFPNISWCSLRLSLSSKVLMGYQGLHSSGLDSHTVVIAVKIMERTGGVMQKVNSKHVKLKG